MNKPTKITIASLFFLLVSALEIYAIITNNKSIEMITKPLITTSLVVVYLLSVSKPNFWYVSALFFAFWGDVLLLFQDQFFVFGLASFLLAHILFITVSSKFLAKVKVLKILTHSFPFLVLLGLLIYIIYPNLGALFIPVLLYGIVISVFGVVTFLIYTNEKTTENLWLFIGALTFIVSDSILAIHKFYQASEMLANSIMITYIIAQYLICKAMIVKSK
ncbi:MAG: lysoplasmalogenase [Flavobacteriaceae bacterium]